MKRIVLFIVTNLAVLAVLGVVVRLFGLDRALQGTGLNAPALLGFAAVYGFGGSLISLAISKWMAKRAVGAHVIEAPQDELQHWLVSTVQRHAQKVGIGMPEVAIYDSEEPNAFATGASRNHALVAVSTGLLHRMSRDEADAVLGHEISHVANGDMVTLALLQGVVNTFVIFLSRAIAFAVDSFLRQRDDNRQGSSGGPVYFLLVMVLQLVLGIFASLIVMWFSRYREFRADRGGAQLAGKQRMIAALERLRQGESELPQSLTAFGIAGGGRAMMNLFRSHPPLEERIAALRALPV